MVVDFLIPSMLELFYQSTLKVSPLVGMNASWQAIMDEEPLQQYFGYCQHSLVCRGKCLGVPDEMVDNH